MPLSSIHKVPYVEQSIERQFPLCHGLTTTSYSSQPTEQPPNIPPALSTIEYTFEGAKISSYLLDQVTSLIPVRYVCNAVETASTLIKIGEVHLY